MLVEQTSAEQNAIVSFSARALEYLPGPESDVRGLVLAIIDSSIRRTTTSDQLEALKDVVACEQCAVERREFVRKLLIEELSKLITKNGTGCSSAMSLVSGVVYDKPHLRIGRLRVSPTVSSGVAAEVKSKVRNFVHGQAMKSEIFAVANLTWYGEITDALVKRV